MRQKMRVTWSQVDEGFYIGSRPGGFVGYISRSEDGSYTAFDLSSRVVGNCVALAEAMALLVTAATVTLDGAPDDE